MSEPIYHHYLSQLYLKKFTPEKGKNAKIRFFDKARGKSGRKRIRDIGGEDHFNRSFSEQDPNTVEKFYAKNIETDAGAALIRILEAKSLASISDLRDILLFFAMTTVRNPKARSRNEEPMKQLDVLLIMAALGEQGLDVAKKRRGRGALPEEHVVMEFPAIEPIFQSLCKKNWALLEAPEASGGFITCDDPLQIIGGDGPRPWGFESEGAVIFAPLSPNLAIIGKDANTATNITTLSLKHVAGFNSETFVSAHRLVFFWSNEFRVLGKTEDDILTWSSLE